MTNSEASSEVTLRDIAAQTGLSLSAVSYAIRGKGNVSKTTKAKVQAAAAKLGYRPNARVAELMSHIRRKKGARCADRIAYVRLDDRQQPAACSVTLQTVSSCVVNRAEKLGYAVEEFHVSGDGMTQPRLEKILRTRGIQGILFSSLSHGDHFEIEGKFDAYSMVVHGAAACRPELHRAGHHHFLGMREALLQVVAAGKKSIGTVLDRDTNERAKRAWSAAFAAYHPLPRKASRLVRLLDSGEKTEKQNRRELVDWAAKEQVEIIITTTSFLPLLPKRVMPVLLDWTPAYKNLSGVDQCIEVTSANAVDLVVGQLTRNEKGPPSDPKIVLHAGIWRDRSRR